MCSHNRLHFWPQVELKWAHPRGFKIQKARLHNNHKGQLRYKLNLEKDYDDTGTTLGSWVYNDSMDLYGTKRSEFFSGNLGISLSKAPFEISIHNLGLVVGKGAVSVRGLNPGLLLLVPLNLVSGFRTILVPPTLSPQAGSSVSFSNHVSGLLAARYAANGRFFIATWKRRLISHRGWQPEDCFLVVCHSLRTLPIAARSCSYLHLWISLFQDAMANPIPGLTLVASLRYTSLTSVPAKFWLGCKYTKENWTVKAKTNGNDVKSIVRYQVDKSTNFGVQCKLSQVGNFDFGFTARLG